MTGQQLVDSVKAHIGDRQTGRIGSQDVNVSVLVSVNYGLQAIVRYPFCNPRELQEILTIDVSSSTNSYSLPTPTLSRIFKDEISVYSLKDGQTSGRYLSKMHSRTKEKMEPYSSSSSAGEPQMYSIFGQSVILYPFPDGDYTVYMKCNTFPPDITLGSANSGLNLYWDPIIEAYATHDCFAKLQQTKDAASWLQIYMFRMKEILSVLNRDPNLAMDITLTDIQENSFSANSFTNPFVTRIN